MVDLRIKKILFKLVMICDCKKDRQKNPNNLEVLKGQFLDLQFLFLLRNQFGLDCIKDL